MCLVFTLTLHASSPWPRMQPGLAPTPPETPASPTPGSSHTTQGLLTTRKTSITTIRKAHSAACAVPSAPAPFPPPRALLPARRTYQCARSDCPPLGRSQGVELHTVAAHTRLARSGARAAGQPWTSFPAGAAAPPPGPPAGRRCTAVWPRRAGQAAARSCRRPAQHRPATRPTGGRRRGSTCSHRRPRPAPPPPSAPPLRRCGPKAQNPAGTACTVAARIEAAATSIPLHTTSAAPRTSNGPRGRASGARASLTSLLSRAASTCAVSGVQPGHSARRTCTGFWNKWRCCAGVGGAVCGRVDRCARLLHRLSCPCLMVASAPWASSAAAQACRSGCHASSMA